MRCGYFGLCTALAIGLTQQADPAGFQLHLQSDGLVHKYRRVDVHNVPSANFYKDKDSGTWAMRPPF